MYCEPEVAEPPTLTVKAEPSALGRSAIRRHRTVRDISHGRDRMPLVDRYSRESNRRTASNSRRRGNSSLDSASRSNTASTNIEAGADFARRAALTDLVYPEASQRVQRRRLRTDGALLRDELHYERPRRRPEDLDAVSELVTSPHPASLGDGSHPGVRSDLRHLNATSNMRASASELLGHPESHPGPDHSPIAPSLRRSPHPSALYPPVGPVPAGSLTSRFAPAHRFDLIEDISLRAFLLRQGYRTNRGISADELSSVGRIERGTAFIPSQDNQGTPRYSLEGTRDHHPSLSPEDDFHRPLLDIMMPDDRLPSLTPPITSIRASTSSFSSNSASYLGAFATASSSTGNLLHAYATVCESTDSEGSTTAEENEHNVQNSYIVNYRLQTPVDGAYLDSRRSSVSLNATELARNRTLSEPGEELLQIQNNLDRLERQVPLEW